MSLCATYLMPRAGWELRYHKTGRMLYAARLHYETAASMPVRNVIYVEEDGLSQMLMEHDSRLGSRISSGGEGKRGFPRQRLFINTRAAIANS